MLVSLFRKLRTIFASELFSVATEHFKEFLTRLSAKFLLELPKSTISIAIHTNKRTIYFLNKDSISTFTRKFFYDFLEF